MRVISDKEYERYRKAKEEIDRAWKSQQEMAQKYYSLRLKIEKEDYIEKTKDRQKEETSSYPNDVMIGIKELEDNIIKFREIYGKDYDQFQIALSAYLVGYYERGKKDEA